MTRTSRSAGMAAMVRGGYIQETFFRPRELAREPLNIPAGLFNPCRLLLARAERSQLFVPLRRMQFQAVIDRREIIFIDHLGGYAVQDGAGGRLIALAWQFPAAATRVSLNAPVPLELVHYRADARALHRRIMSEFPGALNRFIEKRTGNGQGLGRSLVLPFRGREKPR